jgi:hypothetical protein
MPSTGPRSSRSSTFALRSTGPCSTTRRTSKGSGARSGRADKTYQVLNDPAKPKYYVLDMFPYPSGAGLHVGHPLGYIASDIVSRYKRHNGFNVLHPMGYDSFGLPAEQYAIQTGQHPAKTTEENIARYRATAGRHRLQLRLEPRSAHQRSRLLQVDAVDLPAALRQLVRPRRTAGQAHCGAHRALRHEQGWHPTDACALTGDVEEELGAFTAAEWTAFDERTRSSASCSTSAWPTSARPG